MSTNSTHTSSWSKPVRIVVGLVLVVALAVAAWAITQWIYKQTLPFNIPGKVLEYPLWALLVGLAGNLLLKLLNLKETLRPGIRTELFLKIGLVLLGAGINLAVIAKAAGGAILQTLVIMPTVFFFSWWLGKKFGLDEKLRAVMSTAVSVCGVSAAIAAAGSVSAKKEQVSYITTLVILVALPMMVIAPLLAGAMHLADPVAGAWFGGNIDTTAAVVGAGTIYSEGAQEIAAIVKSTQNTLIGLVAFLLALWAASHDPKTNNGKPSAKIIWDRFPKFVLGFVLASILFTLGLIDGGKGTAIDALKNWAFTLAFVCMGLEFSLREVRKMGWRPVIVFLIVTVFNSLVGLGLAYVIFTWLLPIQ